jgi:hypothetical protein
MKNDNKFTDSQILEFNYDYYILSKNNASDIIEKVREKVEVYKNFINMICKEYDAEDVTIGKSNTIRGLGFFNCKLNKEGFIYNKREPEVRRKKSKVLFEYLPNTERTINYIDNINANYCSYENEIIKSLKIYTHIHQESLKDSTKMYFDLYTEAIRMSNDDWKIIIPINKSNKNTLVIPEILRKITTKELFSNI